MWAIGGDYNPPTFYLFSHWSALFFGEVTNFSIRFPSVVFGVLLIPVAYIFGKTLDNKILGLLLAGVVSFLFPMVYYSQNARGYSLVMLAFVVYMTIFLKVYRGDTRLLTIFTIAFFSALCLWSHFYSIIPVVVSWAILAKKHRRILLTIISFVIVLCIPFIKYIGTVISLQQKVSTFVSGPFWLSPLDITIMLPNELFCWSWLIIIPLAVYWTATFRISLFCDLMFISAITIMSCIPMTFITAMSPRYALLVSPLVIAVALIPVSVIINRQDNSYKKIALFLLSVFTIFLFNYGSLLSWYTFNICPYI